MTTAVKFIDLKCNIELICNKHQHAQIFKQPNDTTEAIDSHGTIAFSVEYMKSHMLSNKQYAVTLKCKEKTEYCKCDKNHSRVVSFLSLDKSSYPARKGNAAYLLPTLYFNLTNNSTCPNISVGSIDTSSFVLQYREKREGDISTYPEHNGVDLQIVYSPHYTPTKECNTSLINHFSVKRSVKIGDIIALDTSDDLKNRQALSPMLSQRYPVVYYVVSKINGKLEAGGETYLLQVNNIDLAQDSGAYNTPIPSLIYHTYHSPFPSLVPGLAGLDVYKQRLIDVVRPFVVQRTLNELILLSGPTGCGKSSIVQAVAAYFNMHFVTERCQQLIKDKPKLTEDKIEGVFSRAKFCGPLILLLKNFEVLAKSLDGTADDARVAEFVKSSLNNLLKLDDSRHPVIVIATSTAPQKINKDLYSTCIYNIAIESPSENEREVIIRDLLQSVKHAASTDVAYITQRTAGFYLGDLQTLFVHAQGKANRRADYKNCINQSDVQKALDQMQESHSDAIGAPKIPNVKWDDIGGLEDVKKAIKDTVQLPLEHPELFAAGLKRSGVVLFGPPGTGKTMMAKAVATECSLNFMSVKGPELINMYVGQSEENIRQVFERARSAAPCIIFFDELDSLAPNRGNSGDSGGVMDRIVSQLLAELDGMNKSTDVFVIGATNRLELVDPALLRPGRFDKHLYLGLSTKLDQKVSIIKALTKKFELAQDCDITEIAKTCKMNMTGADYYALCVDALMLSIEKKIKRLERGEREDQSKIVVTRKDFTEANDKLIPSLTAADIETYEKSAANFAAK